VGQGEKEGSAVARITREAMRRWMAAFRARNVAAGLCRDCGEPREAGEKRRLCGYCRSRR